MKIVILMPMISQVGQAKVGSILANYLMNFHEVHVITFNQPTSKDFDYQCNLIRLKPRSAKHISQKILIYYLRILEIRTIKKNLNPDISIGFGNGGILWNTLSGIGEKKIATLRASLDERNETLISKLYFLTLKWTLKKSWKIVPVTKAMNGQLKSILNIDNGLFAYNPIDIGEINKLSKEPTEIDEWLGSNKVLVNTGRYYLAKGRHELVKIFSILKEKKPSLKLLLIGDYEEGDYTGKLIFDYCIKFLETKNFRVGNLNSKEIEKCDVLTIGHQSNPFKYISKCNIFVFPSLWEGFPNALTEALACGIPVVSADCETGPREIIIDDENVSFGILLPKFVKGFDANDFESNDLHKFWAKTIDNLMNNEIEIEKYSKLSFLRAQDFSKEVSCEKWLEIIEN